MVDATARVALPPSVYMRSFHIRIIFYERGRNEHSILPPQWLGLPRRWAVSTFFSLKAGAISSVQDVLGNAKDVAWDAAEARKVIDIDQHQNPFGRLYHIDSIKIQAKDTPHITRQGEHFVSDG